MGTTYSPAAATDGLVMYYDMSNTQKSWRGAPVTNLLPNPAINSVPTTGNGWSTYNTNQYNGATYFSIGTVSSVSSNIVTMTAAHPLRSYDVVTPQTSGGGLTAGTNYLIKKISSTQFSIHFYNSSQDGSQGYINPLTGTYKVYDDFANDVRISINSTSFPTMWWGPPHLPNSGLVKEVRINGCSIPGIPTTDCLRLYHTRSDGVTDGMAYGPDATVTAGVAHTVSFWTKTVNASAVGQYIGYQIYNYGVVSPAGYSFNATLGPVGVWVKQSMTFTPVNPTCISYFFPSSGNIIYDLAHIQFEVGSVANAWTSSSRSTAQALLDLTGKNTLTISSLTYSSDNNNSFSFNGSSNTIDGGNSTVLSNISGTLNVTVEVWVNLSGYGSSSYGVITHKGYPWTWLMENPGNTMRIRFYLSNSGDVACSDSATHALNTWYHFVGTYDGTNMKFYRNGQLRNTVAGSGTLGGASANHVIGSYSGAYFSQGQIPIVKIYNRTLSATEIEQNFNALRTRYGI